MGLLDGGAAAIFSSVFSGFYLDGTLHRWATVDDGQGGGTSSFDDEPVKAQLDSWTQRHQQEPGHVDTDQRILLLAHGVEEPQTDDEITVRDKRWKIAAVTTDPAQSYYELRGRKSAIEIS